MTSKTNILELQALQKSGSKVNTAKLNNTIELYRQNIYHNQEMLNNYNYHVAGKLQAPRDSWPMSGGLGGWGGNWKACWARRQSIYNLHVGAHRAPLTPNLRCHRRHAPVMSLGGGVSSPS